METISQRLQASLCFSAVAEAGSFTAAAALLGCSKAHVSRQVAELERSLGAQLLLRTTRRLVLTALGEAYAAEAARIREALQAAEHSVAAARSEVAGELRLTAATTFGEVFLVELAGAFRALHPQVQIDLDLSIASRDLTGERFDFGFRSTRTLDPRLVARVLGLIRERAVASPALVAKHPPIRNPADLALLPALRNTHFSDDPEWLLTRGAESATVRPHSALSINQFSALKRAAIGGLGVARLPRYLVEEELADARLQLLLPEWSFAPTPIYLVHPQRSHPTLLQRRFRSFCVTWFEQAERVQLLA